MTEPVSAPALKHIFAPARFELVAELLAQAAPEVDTEKFLALSLDGLDALSLMERLRRMSDSLHIVLPDQYPQAIAILKRIVPDIKPGFVTLALCDVVGRYGLDHFTESLKALKFFTPYGSAEFGIRPFLRQDLTRTLATMLKWAHDPDEHVRRLASEGCRPRLPWSFRLQALVDDPTPVLPILDALKSDPSLYVRKSVANHFNDITKTHPEWVMTQMEAWPKDDAHSAWVARHALRTLIKRGDKRALAIIGVGARPKVRLDAFEVSPQQIDLGARMTLSATMTSTARVSQKMEIDYVVHYVKKSGAVSGKVFKLRALTLAAGERITLTRAQVMRDFSTRLHHPGRHAIDLMINGDVVASSHFDLVRP